MSAASKMDLETFINFVLMSTNGVITPLIVQALGMVLIVVMISIGFTRFPGHMSGSLFPIYIQEHYGKRNSQHLLDPYR